MIKGDKRQVIVFFSIAFFIGGGLALFFAVQTIAHLSNVAKNFDITVTNLKQLEGQIETATGELKQTLSTLHIDNVIQDGANLKSKKYTLLQAITKAQTNLQQGFSASRELAIITKNAVGEIANLALELNQLDQSNLLANSYFINAIHGIIYKKDAVIQNTLTIDGFLNKMVKIEPVSSIEDRDQLLLAIHALEYNDLVRALEIIKAMSDKYHALKDITSHLQLKAIANTLLNQCNAIALSND